MRAVPVLVAMIVDLSRAAAEVNTGARQHGGHE